MRTFPRRPLPVDGWAKKADGRRLASRREMHRRCVHADKQLRVTDQSGQLRPGKASARRRGATANPMLGRKVRHPEYGVGTVVGVEGDEDDDRRVSVSFPGRGTKKFIEKYAQLQPA